MRTPLYVATLLLLTACQATTPSAPIDELPHSDPTAASAGLSDAPQRGASANGATASGDH